MPANFHESEGRARKLAKLLDAADIIATELDMHPRKHADKIANFWRNTAGPEHFKRLVDIAKVIEPSKVTVGQFLDALDHRAGT